MSIELIPCPFCGNDEPDTTTIEPLAMNLHDDDTIRCGMESCPIENVTMLVRQWNRRFVCPDEIERLRGLVQDAYYEGGDDAHAHMVWDNSNACKALTK